MVTGNLLFHVHDDVDHIYMIEKIKGRFPTWMVEKCDPSFAKIFHRNGSLNYRYADKRVMNMEEILDL